MSVTEIKAAVDAGKSVHWTNGGYQVVKAGAEYLIKHWQGSCIGLTHKDGVTLNGHPDDFFVAY